MRRSLLLQHVVALSSLQFGKYIIDELARTGLRKEPQRPVGSWFRGYVYRQLVSTIATHDSTAIAATGLESQVSSFSSPGAAALDNEVWASASLAQKQGTGAKLSSLASSMAKVEASAFGVDAVVGNVFGAAFGVLTVVAWLTVFLAETGSSTKFWALSIALSPVGAVLRYTLGLCNGTGPWGSDFPWGTATANILGSGLSCLCCASPVLDLVLCAQASVLLGYLSDMSCIPRSHPLDRVVLCGRVA